MRPDACCWRNGRKGKSMAGLWSFRAASSRGPKPRSRRCAGSCARSLESNCAAVICCCNCRHDYGQYVVELEAFVVDDYRGEPAGLEGQTLQWVRLAALSQQALLPADLPIVDALKCSRGDRTWRRTPACRISSSIEPAVSRGHLHRSQGGHDPPPDPVLIDGSTDPKRAVLYSGQTQLLTPNGVLPLGFEIEAATLEEAVANSRQRSRVRWSRRSRRRASSGARAPRVSWCPTWWRCAAWRRQDQALALARLLARRRRLIAECGGVAGDACCSPSQAPRSIKPAALAAERR